MLIVLVTNIKKELTTYNLKVVSYTPCRLCYFYKRSIGQIKSGEGYCGVGRRSHALVCSSGGSPAWNVSALVCSTNGWSILIIIIIYVKWVRARGTIILLILN